MKRTDALWLENLARIACDLPPRDLTGQNEVAQGMALFLDELCSLLADYSNYFNDLIKTRKPELLFRVFRLGNPRAGLMVLRGRDKLVITGEVAGRIKARIVQVHAYSEQSLDVFDFTMRANDDGGIVWVCLQDGQKVIPELVARYYLCPFLARGSGAFVGAKRVGSSDDKRSSGIFSKDAKL